MKDIFIIGSKGIPAKYGGFETFVDKLTAYKKNSNVNYHVACLAKNENEFVYNNARCFNVKVKNIGSAKAITYDIKALIMIEEYIKKNNLKDSIIYILACRIGPFLALYKNKLERQGIKVYVNPDGHEWKRSKWNKVIKEYWKLSERLMIKHSDLIVCDSRGIEDYIKEEYSSFNVKTKFIAYGADLERSKLQDNDEVVMRWYSNHEIIKNQYYLIVGRFIPENNFETMIREFMASKTNKALVIITNNEENKFFNELLKKTDFKVDKRIKFVGTVYEQELIKKIRENAYAYIHGHEVGGTNPSLLEAMASTKVNVLLDVIFNKEVGQSAAFYFTKERGNLATIIAKVENLKKKEINEMSKKAKARIQGNYSWNQIVSEYEDLLSANSLDRLEVRSSINILQYEESR